MDRERYTGLKSEIPDAELMVIPMEQEARRVFYMEHLEEIKKYTAVFAVSDHYAMDLIQFLKSAGVSVPEDMSVVGFDNVPSYPPFRIVTNTNGTYSVCCTELPTENFITAAVIIIKGTLTGRNRRHGGLSYVSTYLPMTKGSRRPILWEP